MRTRYCLVLAQRQSSWCRSFYATSFETLHYCWTCIQPTSLTFPPALLSPHCTVLLMVLLHSIRMLFLTYCSPSVISPFLTPCPNHPGLCSSPVPVSINVPSPWPALIGTYLCNCVIQCAWKMLWNAMNILSRPCFMKEISHFLQPKLAQSSKKILSPADVPHWHPRAPFPQGVWTTVLLLNTSPVEWAASSCLYPCALPCCGSAHHFCMNGTIMDHTQPVCQPSFSPGTPGVAAAMRRSWGSELFPAPPPTRDSLPPKHKHCRAI